MSNGVVVATDGYESRPTAIERKEEMISAKRIGVIFEDCLFKNEEIINNKPIVEPVKGKGVLNDFGFHPTRLSIYKIEILGILKQLPDSFMQSGGGGMSFLNACVTKEGSQWGEHRNIEQLFALGEALKLVKYPMPKEMWGILPGGMPYVTIVDVEKK